MSRGRRSLSSTASSHLLEESAPVSIVLGEITQNASIDLEDGEITDDASLEESKAVEDTGEGVVRLGSSSERDSRPDGEQLFESLEHGSLRHEHKENTVPKPNTADVDILKLLKGLEQRSGTDFPPNQTPISSPSDSNSTLDMPAADSPRPRADIQVSSMSLANIDSRLFPVSEEELEHAKDVVLDLLGWGVQPEYLIECGISSHAIYRIFTDLHLRLPTNLAYLGSG